MTAPKGRKATPKSRAPKTAEDRERAARTRPPVWAPAVGLFADGFPDAEIGRRLGKDRATIGRWRCAEGCAEAVEAERTARAALRLAALEEDRRAAAAIRGKALGAVASLFEELDRYKLAAAPDLATEEGREIDAARTAHRDKAAATAERVARVFATMGDRTGMGASSEVRIEGPAAADPLGELAARDPAVAALLAASVQARADLSELPPGFEVVDDV